MEEVYNRLEDIISYIQNTKEYQMCISLKRKMHENKEIKKLVSEVKKYQKMYVRSNYDSEVKKELDALEERLEEIPIYVIYLENLMKVNEMIDMVRDSLNDYFCELFNKKY